MVARRPSLVSLLALGFGYGILSPRSLRAQTTSRELALATICPVRPSGAAPDVLDAIDYAVSVTPDGGSATWSANTSGHQSIFTVTNTGECVDTYDFTKFTTGPISGVTLNKTIAELQPGVSTTVTATYSVDAAGAGTLTLAATGRVAGTQNNGYYNVTVTVPPGTPVVDVSPYNFDKQDYGRCANTCFAATTSHATVPYYSLDTPRQVALVYNGDRVSPRPFVHVNVSPDVTYGSWPLEYQLEVKVNGTRITFVNGDTLLRFAYPGTTAPVRIGGQFDATGYPTNVYAMNILVSAVFPTTRVTNDVITKFVVVNQTTAAVARGWTIAGVQRLYSQGDGSALVVDGDGSATYFAKPAGTFVSPAGEFTTLMPSTLSGSNGWARLYRDSTKVVFNNVGLMTRVLDRFGNRDSVIYDGSSRVSQLLDPLNLKFTLTYGTNGLSAIRDSAGRVTSITVDASKRLTAVTDPDNVSTTYGYDASLRLSTITNRRGATDTIAYDIGSGKLASVKAPAVLLVDGTTAGPVTTLSPWQKSGVPYTSTGSSPLTPPRADTVRASVREPGGAIMRFTVNRWGTAAQVINALAETTTTTFDPNGLPIRTAYPTGAVDTGSYNSSGLMTYGRASGLTATNVRYAAYGVPDSIWGTGQASVRHFVGANGRIDSTRVGGVAVTRYHYETRGRVDSVIDAQQHLLVRTYFAGAFGNRSKDSTLGPRVATYVYDAYGRDSLVRTTGLPTRVTLYDQLNRVTQYHDSVNVSPTRYGYDQLYLITVTDPKGQIFRTAYNSVGWVTSRTVPGGDSTRYRYSVDGDLKRVINRRGQNTDFGYDALHRMSSKSGVNTPSESWQYTGNERVLTATSPASTETIYLNVSGLPDSVKTTFVGLTPTFTRTSRYTSAGLRDTLSIAGGGLSFQKRSYGYDTPRGILTSLGLGGAVTSIAANNDGLPTAIRFPSGESVIYQWTASHRSMNILTDAPYASKVERQLSYDSVMRVRTQLPGNSALDKPGYRYGYDGLSRLLSGTVLADSQHIQMPPGCADSLVGNRCVNWIDTTNTWNPTGQRWLYTYDAANNRTDQGAAYLAGTSRITTFGGCTYNTDADGNVVRRSGCLSQTVSFAWQAENRLDSMNVNGTAVKLYYDALGRLVRKDVNGSPVSYFLWDGDNLLAELNGTGSQLKAEYSYYPGADNLHAIVVSGHRYYAHSDGLGNVIQLTDSTKTSIRGYTYDDWGQLTGGGDPLGFNGVDRARWKGALWLGPELDIYYMRNRWYEPFSGRFLSEDPVGLAGGINPYIFGGGDPVNQRDASGLRYWGDDPFPIGGVTVWGDAPSDPWGWCGASCNAALPGGRGGTLDGLFGQPNVGGGGGGSTGGDLGPRDVGEEAVRQCHLAIAQTAIDVFGTGAAVLGGGAVTQAVRRSAANLAEYGSLTLRAGVMTTAAAGARSAAYSANRIAWQNAIGASVTVGNANLMGLGVQAARGHDPEFVMAALGSLPVLGAFVGAYQVFKDMRDVVRACNPK